MKGTEVYPFVVKDCALIQIATGYKAQSLKDLKEYIALVDIDCVYHHFWGSLMAPAFEEPEFNNDFASWVYKELHDPLLAERLAMIDPCDYDDLEDLRQELIDIIEARIDELEYMPVAKYDKQFHFIRGFLVVFDTYRRIEDPADLAVEIPKMGAGSLFYHFIDARRRTIGRMDDFRAWLYGFGERYADLCDQLAEIDPFFTTLTDLRETLARIFKEYFGA